LSSFFGIRRIIQNGLRQMQDIPLVAVYQCLGGGFVASLRALNELGDGHRILFYMI
jgi:hypothetical protein